MTRGLVVDLFAGGGGASLGIEAGGSRAVPWPTWRARPPRSSAYANNLGSLRSLGLIDYRGGEVVAKPVLFLEG